MHDEWGECPSPETLAFDKRTLSKDEQSISNNHLQSCEQCRLVTASHFERDSNIMAPLLTPRRRPLWWAAAAAALIAAIALQPLLRPADGPIKALVQAAPGNRLIEPRLSGGFPWTPFRGLTRGSPDEAMETAEMRLIGVAGSVLEQTENDDSIEAKHAAALAHLLSGQPAEAAELLKSIASKANDARIWSDLAASLMPRV